MSNLVLASGLNPKNKKIVNLERVMWVTVFTSSKSRYVRFVFDSDILDIETDIEIEEQVWFLIMKVGTYLDLTKEGLIKAVREEFPHHTMDKEDMELLRVEWVKDEGYTLKESKE